MAKPTLTQLVARMKREILDDIDGGRVPAAVASFADLHDYVDANCYGGLCDDDCALDLHDDMGMINRATGQVDRWLRSNRKE